MSTREQLRQLGLFDARAPRYTSYPTANHFNDGIGAGNAEAWMAQVPSGSRVSLYIHIPYCRRLCWFCARRTQGTSSDRPLVKYLEYLKAEIALIDARLPKNVELSHINLGGGTPTIFPPDMLEELGAAISALRPRSANCTISVEIDPNEVDTARLAALTNIGVNRASVGVQDFDPKVQETIGRVQSYERTRDVVEMIRDAGIIRLDMDVLYGLPHQTKTRVANSVQRVLSLSPDRVALDGYAHMPWMAKRQRMIPTDALPGAQDRFALFEIARKLMRWDGYREIGINHYARPDDSLAKACDAGTLRRNFQGYTDDGADVLIGLGASAISRFPQGYTQNHPTSSRYAAEVTEGRLATVRGFALSDEDRLRATMIEQIMCRLELDLASLARQFGLGEDGIQSRLDSIIARFGSHVEIKDSRFRIVKDARLIARLVAQELDTFKMPDERHSRAL